MNAEYWPIVCRRSADVEQRSPHPPETLSIFAQSARFVLFVFQSTPLLITTFAAFGFMVLLAWFKYLIAYKVDSRALRTDGKPTLSHLSHY